MEKISHHCDLKKHNKYTAAYNFFGSIDYFYKKQLKDEKVFWPFISVMCAHWGLQQNEPWNNIWNVHDNFNYSCELCGYKAAQKLCLKTLIELLHDNDKFIKKDLRNVWCVVCNKKITRKEHFKIHTHYSHELECYLTNKNKNKKLLVQITLFQCFFEGLLVDWKIVLYISPISSKCD